MTDDLHKRAKEVAKRLDTKNTGHIDADIWMMDGVEVITALLARLDATERERVKAFQMYVDANEARIDAEAALSEALALPEVRGLVEAAILDAQLRAFEQRRLDTPDEIKAAAHARIGAAQEGDG